MKKESLKIEFGSVSSYIWGFVLSLLCTVGAYLLIQERAVSSSWAIGLVSFLAVLQALFQLVFFFQLGKEDKWHRWVFFFMLFVLVILFVGSLWILYHLDYRLMPPEEMKQMMEKGGGF